MPLPGDVSASPQDDFCPNAARACRAKSAGGGGLFILCWKRRRENGWPRKRGAGRKCQREKPASAASAPQNRKVFAEKTEKRKAFAPPDDFALHLRGEWCIVGSHFACR
ncbi:MAG: hypothetical protein ACI4PG_02740 [Candidatus Ventricola sp.]